MKVKQRSLGPIGAPYDYMSYRGHQGQFTESPAEPLRWIHGVQESQLPPQAAPTSNPVEAANGHFIAGFPVRENRRPLSAFPQGTPSVANTFSYKHQLHSHALNIDPAEQAAYIAPANSQVAVVDVRSTFPAQESSRFLPPTPPAESPPKHHEPTGNPMGAATNVLGQGSFVHTDVRTTNVYPSAAPPAVAWASSTSTAAGGSCSREGTAKRVCSRKKTPPFQGLDPLNFKAVKNAIERRRVGTINEGFKQLLNLLPTRYRAKRPTKLSILNGARQCIEHLQEALAKASKDAAVTAAQPINQAPVAEPRQPIDDRCWANRENVSQGGHQGSANLVYAENPPHHAT